MALERQLQEIEGTLFIWVGDRWRLYDPERHGELTEAEAARFGLAASDDVEGAWSARMDPGGERTAPTTSKEEDMSERPWWDKGEEGFGWEDIEYWGRQGLDLISQGFDALEEFGGGFGAGVTDEDILQAGLGGGGNGSPNLAVAEPKRKRKRAKPVITCQDQEDIDFILLTLPKAWHKQAIGILLSGRL